MALTPEQLERQSRHILLKEIGGPGVQKLAAARVSIVGAGALGGPCAMYLAAAGVGEIELWDADTVDRSNLQRQVQFTEADTGHLKVDRLAERLNASAPDCRIIRQARRWSEADALSGDVLIDGTDNFETRFALNRVAHASGRPLVSGAATRWSGQVSVFASGVETGQPCYQCFVPEAPPMAEACEDVGVVGPVTGIVASHMALEAMKIITGAGRPLMGQVLILDGLSGVSRAVKLRQDTDCPVCSA
ncbi:molybdopterin biosynthesis protein MoeB [Henriciella mobilis]|uniref:HesA/MoeB/ThiF family protein n=1 Tax=Henriciella mobilis TaxID=2305467 RepID=UPI000E66F72A|nr:ThiF family adenylyltransferase [Henriciella mobilis]RIJ17124.1 molybdopterin biosynthesis protein MoeB [Henriciella mobilis]RIJ22730.1 molybdopterin biosynthesis protein MoeB [Henriciella mobilis]